MTRSSLVGEIAILLLAAGSSSRLGHSKQLLKVNNIPLLTSSVMAAIESDAHKVVVVLGANEVAHRNLINHLPVDIVHNPTWQKGMGNSLKVGLSHLTKGNQNLAAIVIMVCDQPLITSSHLKKLIQKYMDSKSSIVASYYSGVAGVPSLFDNTLFSKLLSLGDDEGAKKIIQQRPDLVTTIDFPEGAIDIDTDQDLKKFIY